MSLLNHFNENFYQAIELCQSARVDEDIIFEWQESGLFPASSFVIENKEEGYKVYTRLDNAYRFNQNYKRLKDIEWYEYSNIDMAMCTIPHDHKLAKTIERFFSKFIMENK